MADLRVVLSRVRRLFLRHRRPLSALVAGAAALALVQTLAPSPPVRRPVVVAAHDLASGAVLVGSDLMISMLPPSAVPAGSATSPAVWSGRQVAGPMRQGEPITDRRVVGRSLIAGYPPGIVAAPVRIHDPDVVSLLRVGSRIDVYAARDATSPASVVVADVPVISLPRTDDEQDGGLVVLAVTSTQAAALAEASASAPLSLTLRR